MRRDRRLHTVNFTSYSGFARHLRRRAIIFIVGMIVGAVGCGVAMGVVGAIGGAVMYALGQVF